MTTPRKPMDSTVSDFIQQSIRFGAAHLRWLNHESQRTSTSVNAVVRQLVDDAMAWFGLPPTMMEALERDRAERKLSSRQYVQELLTQRYREMLLDEARSEKPTAKSKK
jgi:hypothetical protein